MNKYLHLFNTIDQGVQVCELVRDKKGSAVDIIIHEINPAWEKIMQEKGEAILGRRVSEWSLHLEKHWLDFAERVIGTGRGERREYSSSDKLRWFEVYISPLVGDFYMCLFTDTTDRKKFEESIAARNIQLEKLVTLRTKALEESNKLLGEEHHFLEQITNKSPHLIYVFDISEQRFTYINKRTNELIGKSEDYVYAMGPHLFQAILHPDDLDKRILYMNELISLEDQEIRNMDFRVWNGGVFRWFRSKDSIFLKEDGKVKQIIGLAEDITYEKLLQQKIHDEDTELGLN